jgi:hypothetical protein
MQTKCLFFLRIFLDQVITFAGGGRLQHKRTEDALLQPNRPNPPRQLTPLHPAIATADNTRATPPMTMYGYVTQRATTVPDVVQNELNGGGVISKEPAAV